ncbi:MAG: ATP-binding protein [Planctomycetota bacterium]
MKPLTREARFASDIATTAHADCAFLALRHADGRLVSLAQAGPCAPPSLLEGMWPTEEHDAAAAFGGATLADGRPVAAGLLMPVPDGFGGSLGAIGVVQAQAVFDRTTAERALRDRVEPATSLLEQALIDSELQQLVGTDGQAGLADRLRRILASLARITHAPIAFVTELIDEAAMRGRALVVLNRDTVQGPFEYDLSGTPCAEVYAKRLCFHPSGVRARYPGFKFLEELGAEGYLALPIEDAERRTLGHVGILNDRAFPEELADFGRVRIFASLLGSEVRRSRADDDRLRNAKEHHEAQRLESLGLLASGVAHDFDNLLTAVASSVQQAAAEPGLPAAVTRHLDSIRRSTTAARGLTNELLAYAGHGELQIEPLELSAALEDMEHLFATAAGNTTLLRLRLARDLPPVQASRKQIGQLALNLVLNAVESVQTEGGGLVEVLTSLRKVDALTPRPIVGSAPPGDYVVLEVRDNGEGVEPDRVPRIFEPFRSTKRRGRGLGLAIVQGIVQAHGAALAWDSRDGQGTTVSVWFPATAVANAEAKQVTRSRPVLVVEDQAIVLEATRRLCEQLGHSVRTAADGASAIAEFDAHADEIELVLLDVNLPDLDGRVVLRALRARRADVPILLTSGYVRDGAQELTAKDPFTGFLRKPFRAHQVAESIASLDAARATRESVR